MTIALSRTAPAPQPLEDPAQPGVAPAAAEQYASRYQLPQIAQHDQAAQAKLADAHAQAVAATGGFLAAPLPSPPLPPGIVHDAPGSQQWLNSAAGAPDPAAAVFAPKGTSSAATQAIPLGRGISGERALGLPDPPLTPSRLRDSDIDYDEDEDMT